MLEYHHRLIVILEAEKAVGYLAEMTPQERFDYLIENRYTGTFETTKVRNMAKGWEKKIDIQNSKLKNEMYYREVLKSNDVDG